MEQPTSFPLQDHPLAYLNKQIEQVVERDHKGLEALKISIQQFRAKQLVSDRFDKQEFSKTAYSRFVEGQTLLEGMLAKMVAFPFLEKLASLLTGISNQLFLTYRFINEHWQQKYQLLQDVQRLKTKKPVAKSQLCLNCSENIWHQQIKAEKHKIFNLRIEDPFYYFQQAPYSQKEAIGDEIDHKVLQEKLSELALGVELQQKCLNQLLASMADKKDPSNADNIMSSVDNEDISLPVMPMLRSVFHHVRGIKKSFQDIGIQVAILPKVDNSIDTKSSFPNDLLDKQLAQCKLITQITDKTVQIKTLEEKIIQAQKSQSELRAQQGVLMEQNMSLQKKNSFLEVQLSMSKPKNRQGSKLKMINKNKKVDRNIPQDFNSTTNNISSNPQSTQSQQTQQISNNINESNILKSKQNTGMIESKFKAQPSQNKTMFISNAYASNQLSLRQSVTPGKLSSAISIERHSGKQDEQIAQSVVDFPSIRPSIHSNQGIEGHINSKMTKKRQKFGDNHQSINLGMQQLGKSKRMLKQLTKTHINTVSANLNHIVRSQNPSPQNDLRIRRKGKFQDRESLLRMLFQEQVKETSQNPLSFGFFKRSYETFVTKIKGISESDNEIPKVMNFTNLHKKSTISIKQYFRNEIDSREQNNMQKQNIAPHEKYARQSSCLRDIMNNLFAEGIELISLPPSDLQGNKPLLRTDEVGVMTEILAYLIQLKVNNPGSYIKVKTIILVENNTEQHKHRSIQAKQENRQLKASLTSLIISHRRCKSRAQSHNYCVHLQGFLKGIIALM